MGVLAPSDMHYMSRQGVLRIGAIRDCGDEGPPHRERALGVISLPRISSLEINLVVE